MNKLWTRFLANRCEHQNTSTIRSVGVERIVCDACGNVSFSIAPNLMLSHELVPHYENHQELSKVSGL